MFHTKKNCNYNLFRRVSLALAVLLHVNAKEFANRPFHPQLQENKQD